VKRPDYYAERAEAHLQAAADTPDLEQRRYHLDAAAVLAQLALAAATTPAEKIGRPGGTRWNSTEFRSGRELWKSYLTDPDKSM
jgi:hypothetical protein